MTKKSISALALLLGLACRPPVRLNPPYFVLNVGDMALVVEGVKSPEEVVRFKEGTLQLRPLPEADHYKLEGSGTFSVRELIFDYEPPAFTCRCSNFDPSKGAVVVRRDGSLVSAYLLPLFAK